MPQVATPASEQGVWRVIWLVGGAVWLVAAALYLLWLQKWAGTRFEGEYVLTSTGLALKYAAVFVLAAGCYRIALALGWPDGTLARLRVAVINVLMVLAVLWWAELVNALAMGFIDGQSADMQAGLHSQLDFLWRVQWFASLMKSYFIPYALALCAIELTLVNSRRHREAVQAAELARAYATTRMALLSAQLQPHFLFNTLNALTELIEEDPRKAAAMVVRLGNFLRHALQSGQSPWVVLATEVAGLQTYLDIQRVRFGDGIKLVIDVSPEVLDVEVPSLILQPLVENAIEHGRRQRGPQLAVSIQIGMSEGRLLIRVHNSRPRVARTLTPQAYGRGLSNVELRLRVAYGDDAQLVLSPAVTEGTLATVSLPVRRVAAAPSRDYA